MMLRHFLWASWHWEPSVVLGCAACLGGYLAALRFRPPRRAWAFGAGVLLLLLALVSPLDLLSDTYLFSAHMFQHLILELVVPPLLLLGIPPGVARGAVARPGLRQMEGLLGHPVVAWFLGVGMLYAWHLPVLYNAALANESIHAVQHVCFLVTATSFWWPVLTPLAERRLSPLATLLYLMAAGMAQCVLGILVGYVPQIQYPAYIHPDDPWGLLPLIRNQWGLGPMADRRLGGFLMAIGGGLTYAGIILGRLVRWGLEERRAARLT